MKSGVRVRMQISTAGKTDSGFTLIELIVVVFLITLSLGIVVGVNFKQRDSLQVKSTSRQLYSFLLTARSLAILNNQVNRCWYLPERDEVVADIQHRSLSVPAKISLTLPGQEPLAGEKVLLAYFYSDGSGGAGNFCIQSGKYSIMLQIDPLLGFVSLLSGCDPLTESVL